jgi:hypothetical protein
VKALKALTDVELDATGPMELRCAYSALRDHHVEETRTLTERLATVRAQRDAAIRRVVELEDAAAIDEGRC